jgi:hypothetical protein
VSLCAVCVSSSCVHMFCVCCVVPGLLYVCRLFVVVGRGYVNICVFCLDWLAGFVCVLLCVCVRVCCSFGYHPAYRVVCGVVIFLCLMWLAVVCDCMFMCVCLLWCTACRCACPLLYVYHIYMMKSSFIKVTSSSPSAYLGEDDVIIYRCDTHTTEERHSGRFYSNPYMVVLSFYLLASVHTTCLTSLVACSTRYSTGLPSNKDTVGYYKKTKRGDSGKQDFQSQAVKKQRKEKNEKSTDESDRSSNIYDTDEQQEEQEEDNDQVKKKQRTEENNRGPEELVPQEAASQKARPMKAEEQWQQQQQQQQEKRSLSNPKVLLQEKEQEQTIQLQKIEEQQQQQQKKQRTAGEQRRSSLKALKKDQGVGNQRQRAVWVIRKSFGAAETRSRSSQQSSSSITTEEPTELQLTRIELGRCVRSDIHAECSLYS